MLERRGANGVEQLLICRVASKLCGLPLLDVIEIMRPLPLEPLANMPSFVRGLSLIRGRPTPVLAACALLGSSATDAAFARYVTLKVQGRPIALLVDAVVGIRSVDRAQLEQLPLVLRDPQAEQVDALGSLDTELLLVLEHTRLLTEAQLETLEEGRA